MASRRYGGKSMSAELQTFQFDSDTELTFTPHDSDGFRVTGPQLARALGFRDAFRLMESIPDAEKGYTTACTPGGEQKVGYLTEAGFYRVLGQRQAGRISDPAIRDRVERFQAWVYREVLPAIRKNGTYSTAHPLQGPELIAAALIESQKVIEARESRIHQLETRAAIDAPKVTYVDTYVTDADLLSFSTVASTNGVKESWLRDLLIARDWIYLQADSRWSEKQGQKVVRNRYSEKADKKRYFRRVEVHEAPRFRGSEVMHTLKVTPQGAEAIARLVAREAAAS